MNKNYDLSIKIRPANDDDMPIILTTWATSISNDMALRYERDVQAHGRLATLSNKDYNWASNYALASRLLENPRVSCSVASQPDYLNQVYGYVVHHNDIMLWIYTKDPFREAHIASRLVDDAFGDYDIIRIPVVTYSISHYREKWNLALDYNCIGDLVKWNR